MPSRRLLRRTVLRGLGATVALPLLDVMPAAAVRPRRRGPGRAGLREADGLSVLPERDSARHLVSGGDRGRRPLVKLNEWMRPLEPFKEHLLIPSNIWTPEGNGHVGGPPTWLTGGSYDRMAVNAGGVSADQVAARHLRDETMLPSLELSVQGEGLLLELAAAERHLVVVAGPADVSRDRAPRLFDRMFRPPSGGATDRSVMGRGAGRRQGSRQLRERRGPLPARRVLRVDTGPRAPHRVRGAPLDGDAGRRGGDRHLDDPHPGHPGRPTSPTCGS